MPEDPPPTMITSWTSEFFPARPSGSEAMCSMTRKPWFAATRMVGAPARSPTMKRPGTLDSLLFPLFGRRTSS